jgi:hypothetical protein
MPKIVRAIIVAAAIAPSACNPNQELGLTHIPPVLSADLDLESTEPQVRTFEFDTSGNYELRYTLRLRRGPGSSPGSHELAGLVRIYDADSHPRLEQSFREHIGPNQVGGTILSFDSGPVVGSNPHTLSLQLEPSPGLVEHYTDLHVLLKRQPTFPLLD